jgi:hypothetical protein
MSLFQNTSHLPVSTEIPGGALMHIATHMRFITPQMSGIKEQTKLESHPLHAASNCIKLHTRRTIGATPPSNRTRPGIFWSVNCINLRHQIQPSNKNSDENNKQGVEDAQYETEAAGGLGVLVEAHDDLLDLAGAGEELVGLLLRGVEGHVPDVRRRRCLQRRLVLLLRPVEAPVPVRRQLVRVLEEERGTSPA